jgi:Lipid A 3-O-deacylase (PagL)
MADTERIPTATRTIKGHRAWPLQIFTCAIIVSSLTPPPLNAQSHRSGSAPPRADRNRFSVWSGFSFDSRGPLGAVADRHFFVGAVRYRRLLVETRRFRFHLAADAVPFAFVTGNFDSDAFVFPQDTVLRVGPGHQSTVYGFGISPLGFEASPWRASWFEIVTDATGGFLSFSRAVPFRNARRFNFTFEIGAGLRLTALRRLDLTVGYRLHHLSNAGTGPINPGLDANLLYVELASH